MLAEMAVRPSAEGSRHPQASGVAGAFRFAFWAGPATSIIFYDYEDSLRDSLGRGRP